MITQKDKDAILEAFKMVDVKDMDIEHADKKLVKWFRFGSHNGMMVASEIIKKIPVKQRKSSKKAKS